MGLRERTIERPVAGTCDWPLEREDYQAWLTRSKVDVYHGLLWLIGHPGSGKSVLVKHLASNCALQAKCPEENVAAFFFDARGSSKDQKSMKGLLQGLLYQLLPLCTKTLHYLCTVYDYKGHSQNGLIPDVTWEAAELQEMMLRLCSEPRPLPLFIFIDAIDECGDLDNNTDANAESVVPFLIKLAETARNAQCNLNICMSSRRHLAATTRVRAEVSIDHANHADIKRYVRLRTSRWPTVLPEHTVIESEIIARAGGIFLWAKLVLTLLEKAITSGFKPMMSMLKSIPDKMEEVFDQILEEIPLEERQRSLRLFQWVLFAQRPLMADEWYHVLALIHEPKLKSIREWKKSQFGIESLRQLETRVVNMTGGLLEILLERPASHGGTKSSVAALSTSSVNVASEHSISGYAGSMASCGPEAPVIRFIHESVHQYFLNGNGFKKLSSTGTSIGIGDGHMYIMETCLAYTCLKEMGPLLPDGQPSIANSVASDGPASTSRVSVASFGSSAATSSRRSSNAIINKSGKFNRIQTLPTTSATSLLLRDAVQTDRVSTELSNRSTASFNSTSSSKAMRASCLLQPVHTWVDGSASSVILTSFELRTPSNSPSLPDGNNHSAEEQTSQMLFSEYPALRLYCIDMFYHHAIAADANGANPENFLEMIEHEETIRVECGWAKWCRLNEGIRSDSTPAYLAAEWNIPSWIEWYATNRLWRLDESGGTLRFPLIAAWFRGHDSIVAQILPNVIPTVIDYQGEEQAWSVIHHLAAREGGEAVLSQLCDTRGAEWLKYALKRGCSWDGKYWVDALDMLRHRAARSLAKRLQCAVVEPDGLFRKILQTFKGKETLSCLDSRPQQLEAQEPNTIPVLPIEPCGSEHDVPVLWPDDVKQQVLAMSSVHRSELFSEIRGSDPVFQFLTQASTTASDSASEASESLTSGGASEFTFEEEGVLLILADAFEIAAGKGNFDPERS